MSVDVNRAVNRPVGIIRSAGSGEAAAADRTGRTFLYAVCLIALLGVLAVLATIG